MTRIVIFVTLVALLLVPSRAAAQARVTGADLHGTVCRSISAGCWSRRPSLSTNAQTNIVRTTETRGERTLTRCRPFRLANTSSPPHEAASPRRSVTTSTCFSRRVGRARLRTDLRACGADGHGDGRGPAGATLPTRAVSSVVNQAADRGAADQRRNFISFSVITPGVTTDRTPQQGASADLGTVVCRPARALQQHHGRRPRQQRPHRRRRARDLQPGSRSASSRS